MAAVATKMARMPPIMYGTAWKKARTTELVVQAVKAGFRGIDTACQPKHYREDLVGAALRTLFAEGVVAREDMFIQTKFTSIDGQDTAQPLPYDPSAPVDEQVRQSFARSLQNLGVGYIDAVVLHSPLRTRECGADAQATLLAYRTLEGLVHEGKVHMLGVSNCYDPELLRWLIGEARVKLGVVQNRWYEGNNWDWAIYDICKANDIAYQSFWTLSGSPTLLSHRRLLKAAKKYVMTPEQTVYKLAQLWGITPLCGSTSLQHMRDALRVEQISELTEDKPKARELWTMMRR